MMPHPEDQKAEAHAEDLEGPEYEVGYKKPPLVSQFKKGQSGNPKGRPKGTKNLQTDLLEEFQESIQIHEGGRSAVISKQRALIKRLMEKALKGGERAAEILLKWAVAMGRGDEGSGSAADLSAEDEAILKLFRTHGSPEDPKPVPKKGTS
jgi:hypothetical protein